VHPRPHPRRVTEGTAQDVVRSAAPTEDYPRQLVVRWVPASGAAVAQPVAVAEIAGCYAGSLGYCR
jgi:hypothetical protein